MLMLVLLPLLLPQRIFKIRRWGLSSNYFKKLPLLVQRDSGGRRGDRPHNIGIGPRRLARIHKPHVAAAVAFSLFVRFCLLCPPATLSSLLNFKQ
jgi:hypothetical protein